MSPNVASALAVAEAQLVIANGAGYDEFMSQLLAATVNAGRVTLSVRAVLGAYGPDVNPYFWYDIPQVPRVAAAIEAALARLDPRDAMVFAGNLAAFDASLRPVESVIASIRRRYPGAPVAYTERVPGYVLQAAGFTVVTPPGFAAAIENGNDPSAGDTAQMFRLITSRRAKVLPYNAQATSPVTQQVRALARQSGIPVVAVTAAQVVGTLLVLSLAITPAAAAQRLSASPLAVAALSVLFAAAAADGGLLASFGASNIKASVFITSISFAIYLTARLAGPVLRDRRRHDRGTRRPQPHEVASPRYAAEPADTSIAAMPCGDKPPGQLDRHVPSGLGWPGGSAGVAGRTLGRSG